MVTVHADKGTWTLHGDVQAVLERTVSEAIPPFRDDKSNDSLAVRNAQVCSSPSSFLYCGRAIWRTRQKECVCMKEMLPFC